MRSQGEGKSMVWLESGYLFCLLKHIMETPSIVSHTLRIPPLSVNTLWRVNYKTRKMYRSTQYVAWAKQCASLLEEVWKDPPIAGPCSMAVTFSVSRVGDLDNMLKSLLDAMQTIVFEDDTQIESIAAVRKKVTKGNESIVFSIGSVQ